MDSIGLDRHKRESQLCVLAAADIGSTASPASRFLPPRDLADAPLSRHSSLVP